MPLLTETARRSLLGQAEQFCYAPEVKTVGAADQIVRTEYSAFEISDQALFLEFQFAFQGLLDREFAKLDRYPFNSKQEFNAMVLQRYLPGELGITPHRDSLRAIHLIALINLGGTAEFYRCDDRQGRNSIQLDTTPGNAILMRAPGFLNAQIRPFHYLTNIRSIRYSLGLRQHIDRA
ncbi:hypothetical protein H6F67_03495 [Microcoleus sp. FACHB-1515]|uniref:hypothetical protein n=1 Tax=Cyanophyceae TaxID=3028117 RepID=UPI001684760E|nr:hypothetical protein [Microcoleus sp. FACHB-1515]MBD2088915.1 hypothetical protein [Microcoleus sp. FACHB-1515]